MKISRLKRIAVVESTDPEEFEELFNSKMEELAFSDSIEHQIYCTDRYRAVITYEQTVRTFDCVADEFHAEGIRYLCRHCPDLEDPHDKRIKHCICKFAELGATHKDREACDYFYRRLKAGKIEPIEEGVR